MHMYKIFIFQICISKQTVQLDKGEDTHSIQQHEASLRSEVRKARPRIETMQSTMERTVGYRTMRMAKCLSLKETIEEFPYLQIPQLVITIKEA